MKTALTPAQEYVYYLLKSGHKINFNPEGTDPVYDKDGKLITHLSFKKMKAMMRKNLI